MTNQTHAVSTDALATLGTIIDETAGRDAIHLAVEPAIAGEKLSPGQHVGFDIVSHRAYGKGHPFDLVGVVDPFLSAPAQTGQRFWLVVYPRQITSLRHVWEHPAFTAPAAMAPLVPLVNDAKARSEKWMRAWALMNVSADYYGDKGKLSDDEAYANAINAGHDMNIGPYENARDNITDEWWGHWETITGKAGQRGEYFSCSC